MSRDFLLQHELIWLLLLKIQLLLLLLLHGSQGDIDAELTLYAQW